ncbi:hypothetical protein C2E23DRAFT_813292 [Lenzites betulinus]|nr:hypothetical protein C2E23DRAFT_813292 [Lenzites betulinus]
MSTDADINTVDDNQQPPFDYDGNFILTPIPGDTNVWGGYVRAALEPGPSAQFTLTGSQVSVYGHGVVPIKNGAEPPLSVYSVGDTHLQAFVPDAVSSPVDNVAFFNSSVLPYGEYTLTINVTRASADAPFYLDYARYNITNPSASSPAPVTTSIPPSSQAVAPSSTLTTTPSSTPATSSPPVGPIVGGVVGGVVVIVAAVIAFVYCRFTKRYKQIPLSPLDPTTPTAMAPVTPYMVYEHTTSQSRVREAPSGMYSAGTSATLRDSKLKMANDRITSPSTSPSTIGSSSSAPSHTNIYTPTPETSTNHDQSSLAERGRHMTGKGSQSAKDSGGMDVQADSGVRFQSGSTPSNVAPMLSPGTTSPIRSMPTVTEVARADVPPAYTPN